MVSFSEHCSETGSLCGWSRRVSHRQSQKAVFADWTVSKSSATLQKLSRTWTVSEWEARTPSLRFTILLNNLRFKGHIANKSSDSISIARTQLLCLSAFLHSTDGLWTPTFAPSQHLVPNLFQRGVHLHFGNLFRLLPLLLVFDDFVEGNFWGLNLHASLPVLSLVLFFSHLVKQIDIEHLNIYVLSLSLYFVFSFWVLSLRFLRESIYV